MKPFSKLTHRGQVRRLREMALVALEHYDLQVEQISLLQHLYNTLFRLVTATGDTYVLRINAAGRRDLAEIRSEMMWLEALRRDTELQVPTPLLSHDDRYVVTVEIEGIPEARHCVIFGWVPGRQFRRRPSIHMVQQMGLCLAKLHNHADQWQPPEDFWLKPLNQLEPSSFWETLDPILFPAQRIQLFQYATQQAQQALEHLYADKQGLRVIHADVHQGNVKLDNGVLQIFDFDDCAWGYPVQDIAISMYYLAYRPNVVELHETFLQSYRTLRAAPRANDKQLKLLMVARELLVMAFVAQSDNPRLQEHTPYLLSGADARLRQWLEVKR